MLRRNLSTSSFSKRLATRLRQHSSKKQRTSQLSSSLPPSFSLSPAVQRGLAFAGLLIAFDLAVNWAFPYPTDVNNVNPGKLALYFDHGRSTRSKVWRQLGDTPETSAPLAQTGWIETIIADPLEPTQPHQPQDLFIAVYGMSFSTDIVQQLGPLLPGATLRMISGPASPPNHSFATYQQDQTQIAKTDIAIFGILASSVKGTTSLSNMTWAPEVPAPYTYPRYVLQNQILKPIWPKIQSLEDLHQAKQNPAVWQAFERQLKTYDAFYDPIIVSQFPALDHSTLLRLVRRAWSQRQQQQVNQPIHTIEGFNAEWEGIPVLEKLIETFAANAQQRDQLPIVLLIHDQGYDDHLYQVLKPTLTATEIPYLSTHEIVPATNPKNFQSDGHFTPEGNAQLARALLTVIQTHYPDAAAIQEAMQEATPESAGSR